MRSLVVVAVLACTACASGPTEDPFLALARKCDAAPGASTCAAAGDYLWEHNGNKLVACTTRLAVSCQRDNEIRAQATRRLDKLAFEYHDRACLFGHADACYKAGVFQAVEASTAPAFQAADLASQAESRFDRACQLGSKWGCRNKGSTRSTR